MRGDPPSMVSPPSSKTQSTPHARGSTDSPTHHDHPRRVYPACAGIHLSPRHPVDYPGRLPRMRGDPPPSPHGYFKKALSTPHARGSTVSTHAPARGATVYPACAGIHPARKKAFVDELRLPRMRGDPPRCSSAFLRLSLSTPHARGSTCTVGVLCSWYSVYPACAGIHRRHERQRRKKDGLPRMRGDPPSDRWRTRGLHSSTPHARGSTCIRQRESKILDVYPACAGIHRILLLVYSNLPGLPRMRGDPPVSLHEVLNPV